MRRKEPTPNLIVDYSAARAHAIRWLGDRYLLARPINASRHAAHPPVPGLAVTSDVTAAPVVNTPDAPPPRTRH